jgi:predicted extracellular nuclease
MSIFIKKGLLGNLGGAPESRLHVIIDDSALDFEFHSISDPAFAPNATVSSGVNPLAAARAVAPSDANAPTPVSAPPRNSSYWSLAGGNFSQDWSNAGLITTNDDWSGVPSIQGFLGQDITTGTGADPQTLTADSLVANDLDVVANQTNPGITNGGVAEFTGASVGNNSTIALQGSGTADAPHIILYLDATGRQNITFSANIRDLDASADNAVMQVAVQYRTTPGGAWTNLPTAYIADATTGPSIATLVTAINVTLPAAANNASQLQIRIMTTNAAGNDEWVGIDDILVTSSPIAASPGSLAINDVTLAEGDAGTTNFTFTVTRSGGSSGAVSADWALANGTSDNGDFAAFPQSGTVSFADGETSQTITITVAGDTAFEGNDSFFVNLTNATGGATITDAQGLGTITNDDAAPNAQLAINDVTLAEGNSGTTNFTFTVTRSGDTSGTSSATWTVNNGTTDAADFTGTLTGTISFAAGEASQTITVQVQGDTGIESNETFTVDLTNPSVNTVITDAQGQGTITNDDAAAIANVWVNEINYDPAGADANEFIEIAGVAGTDLTGWSLVLYNGSGGASYATLNLSGTIANTTNGYGFLKVNAVGLQNGSPDGIALVDNLGRVVQFLSYEGVMTATNGPANGLTSTDIGVDQLNMTVGFTLQLQGSGSSYGDFTWATNVANTEGAVNGAQSFLSPTDPGEIRVLDASVAEGNSGTTLLTFTVRRAGGTALTSDVTYTINLDGTANAVDLGPGAVLSGTVQFAAGEVQRTITLEIQGDTVGEFNETLSVTLNSVTNATIVDGNAIGTIINDDPLSLRIFQIQGKGHISAYVGQNVTTTGIVTAVDTDGYYVQDAVGDNRWVTSDAIFVFTGGAPTVAVGDSISVTGTVAEVRPGNNTNNFTSTQLTPTSVTVLSSGNALPAASLIGTGGRLAPTEWFDNDGFTIYDPTDDAADFWEAFEGMRVTIDAPIVTSPTNSFGETFVVASGGTGSTGLNSRGGMTISGNTNNFDDYNPERIQIDDDSGLFAGFTPNFTQGDRLSNVTGILSYNFQNYELLVTEAVTITTDVGALPREITTLTGSENRLSMATYNVENLDPGDGKFNILAADIVYNLLAPDIISLNEIQDADGAGAGSDLSGYVTAQGLIDAIAAIGGPNYVYIEVTPSAPGTTGGEPGGNIRNGFLYNMDRVGYVANSAVAVPGTAFNGSRYPLSAQFTFNGETITAISVHSTSRGGSDPLFGANQPPTNAGESQRIAQSIAIQAYVANILNTDPDAFVAVMGDFNAFWFEQSLELIEGSIMTNLHRLLAEEERYSYVFEGNAQTLDHILVTNNLAASAQFDAVHINSEQPATPARGTDHDPMLATLLLNSAAVAQAGSGSGNEDTQITGTLVANDRNGDILTYAIVDQPTNGTVTFGANGAYTYTPNANFNGSDSFTFRANDGTVDGSVATVSLTVNPVNDRPNDVALLGDTVAENSTNGTVVGTAVASDPDVGSTFTYRLVDNAGGRFAIDLNTGVITVADGSLLDYESATSYFITIRVFDGVVGSSYKETFIINISDVNEIASARRIVANEDGGQTALFAADNDNVLFFDTSVTGHAKLVSAGAFVFDDADIFASSGWRDVAHDPATLNSPLLIRADFIP